MSIGAAYRVDPERITWDEIDGETLIIHTETGYYFSLADVGSLIWEMLVGGLDEAAMVERIVAEYEVDAGTARADLRRLVAHLVEEQLIEPLNAEVR